MRHTHFEESGYNASFQCIFHEEQGALSFDSRWILVPSVLGFLSIAVIVIGYFEFICAQTPYSMRGLMFGAVYCNLAVSSLIGYGITKLFTSEIIS